MKIKKIMIQGLLLLGMVPHYSVAAALVRPPSPDALDFLPASKPASAERARELEAPARVEQEHKEKAAETPTPSLAQHPMVLQALARAGIGAQQEYKEKAEQEVGALPNQTECFCCLGKAGSIKDRFELGEQQKRTLLTYGLCGHRVHFSCIGNGFPVQQKEKVGPFKKEKPFECPICLEDNDELGGTLLALTPVCGHANCLKCWIQPKPGMGKEAENCSQCRVKTNCTGRYRFATKAGSEAQDRAGKQHATTVAVAQVDYKAERRNIDMNKITQEIGQALCPMCRGDVVKPHYVDEEHYGVERKEKAARAEVAPIDLQALLQEPQVDEQERKRQEEERAKEVARVEAEVKEQMEKERKEGVYTCVQCDAPINSEEELKECIALERCTGFMSNVRAQPGVMHYVHNKCKEAMAKEDHCKRCPRGISPKEVERLWPNIVNIKEEQTIAAMRRYAKQNQHVIHQMYPDLAGVSDDELADIYAKKQLEERREKEKRKKEAEEAKKRAAEQEDKKKAEEAKRKRDAEEEAAKKRREEEVRAFRRHHGRMRFAQPAPAPVAVLAPHEREEKKKKEEQEAAERERRAQELQRDQDEFRKKLKEEDVKKREEDRKRLDEQVAAERKQREEREVKAAHDALRPAPVEDRRPLGQPAPAIVPAQPPAPAIIPVRPAPALPPAVNNRRRWWNHPYVIGTGAALAVIGSLIAAKKIFDWVYPRARSA